MRQIFYLILILSVTLTIYLFEMINDSHDVKNENFLATELLKAGEKFKLLQNQYFELNSKLKKFDNYSDELFLQNQRLKLKSVNDSVWSNVSPLTKPVIENGFLNNISINLPYVYQNLECLIAKNSCLHLNFYLGQHDRTNSSIMIGIPTVRRTSKSYLVNTLESIISKSSPNELADVTIVVFIGEVDMDFIISTVNEIIERFPTEVESGLIEIISPMKSYYINFDTIHETFNDNIDRVRWRTKQVFDFSFLMAYSYLRAPYYLQLEDDIIAKDNFLTTIKDFIVEKSLVNSDWFYLEFCKLGFIGKLFPSSKIIDLLLFFYIFYNDKPVDWLLMDYSEVKYCNVEMKKECKKMLQRYIFGYRKSLFQHTGMESSLKGKIQKAKDKSFGVAKLNYPHVNPMATIYTSLNSYKMYNLASLYTGKNFFWGLEPKVNDEIRFSFNSDTNHEHGIALKKLFLRSGHAENKNDLILDSDAVIEILPFNHTKFQFLGTFNKYGIASKTFTSYQLIVSIRIRFLLNMNHWIIISEILIEEDSIMKT